MKLVLVLALIALAVIAGAVWLVSVIPAFILAAIGSVVVVVVVVGVPALFLANTYAKAMAS